MATDLSAYRSNEREQERVADLFKLITTGGHRALDIGARDGYLSLRLADRFDSVVALDLEKPEINDPRILSVKGSASELNFPDQDFDVVLCAEVLEHIPPPLLPVVCSEIARVAKKFVVIGVPYKQDLRNGRTTCQSCGRSNPPWGHVNSFDERRLADLFPSLVLENLHFVGTTTAGTNRISEALLDFAGNPYGTWEQEESCIHCGASIGKPPARAFPQRLATKLGITLNYLQGKFATPRGNWIHALFVRATSSNENPKKSVE